MRYCTTATLCTADISVLFVVIAGIMAHEGRPNDTPVNTFCLRIVFSQSLNEPCDVFFNKRRIIHLCLFRRPLYVIITLTTFSTCLMVCWILFDSKWETVQLEPYTRERCNVN